MTNVSHTKSNCEPCHTDLVATKRKERAGLLTGVFLALLPKCPFCVMAYSSTVMLCTEGSGMHHGVFSSATTLIITVIFCVVALVSIFLNYRDKRTVYAFLLAAFGSVLIILSITLVLSQPLYYFGIAFLFSGVWLNASLLSFVKKIKHRLNNTSTNQSV